jgi:hypothetical protein
MLCRLRWLIATFFVVATWQLTYGQAPPSDLPKAAEATPESRTQKWEFGTSIRAVGGPCTGIYGTFPVPADWPEQQVKVVGEQISPSVRHSYRAVEGLKQVVFEVPQLATGEMAECYVTFAITKTAQVAPADTTRLVIPKDPPRDIKKFLNPSPQIESTNTKVRALARELPAGKETAWEQVRAIAEGVREKVQFEPDPKNIFKGVIGALRDGKADREDLTATFVAVCRAAKIPARMVWAMDYCYAEFYLEETPVEPAGSQEKAVKLKKTSKQGDVKGDWFPCVVHMPVELGTVTDFRPILEKGDNFRVPELEKEPPQRFVTDFLKVQTARKPAVERRKRLAD